MFTELILEEVLPRLLKGVTQLADLVSSTMGPKGRFVLIKQGDYPASATKDGVTVANSIDLGNTPEGVGVSLIKEAATRTVNAVGDGTTASTVLAHSLIKDGIDAIQRGANPVLLKKGIEQATAEAVKHLEGQSSPAEDLKTLVGVATISANNDTALGKLIGEAVYKVGKHGNVKVESDLGFETTLEYRTGYTIPRGYESPHFINSDSTMDVRYQDSYILLLDQRVTLFGEVESACRFAALKKKPLVIVAHSFDQNVINLLGFNNKEGKQFAAVQAEGVGKDRTEILTDLAILSGAIVLPDREVGEVFEKALGSFDKVEIKREETTFIDGKGSQENFETLIASLKTIKEADVGAGVYHKIKERLSKLMNGIGILKVGAETPAALGEVMDRVDDATKATRAAVKYGVVLGGGLSYLKAAMALQEPQNEHKDIRKGYDIVSSALATPLRVIVRNSGGNDISVLKKIVAGKAEVGYNALTGEYEDFVESNLFDPTKVTTSALKAASSVAGVVLTASGIITSEPGSAFGPQF